VVRSAEEISGEASRHPLSRKSRQPSGTADQTLPPSLAARLCEREGLGETTATKGACVDNDTISCIEFQIMSYMKAISVKKCGNVDGPWEGFDSKAIMEVTSPTCLARRSTCPAYDTDDHLP
jgi:hypothetical protein